MPIFAKVETGDPTCMSSISIVQVWKGFGSMGMCLDEDCKFQNRDKARFCAKCGIPAQGVLLQERYEIHSLVSKDHRTVTLHAIDRDLGLPVTVRALIPNKNSAEARQIFLQDAELAIAFSNGIDEAGSIRVTDYGQDGPLVFLVKSELNGSMTDPARPRMAVREGLDVFPPAQLADDKLEDDMQTELRPVVPKEPPAVPQGAAGPQLKRDWLAEGDRFYELGSYEKARAAYEAALADNSVAVEAWSGKGATLLHLGRAAEALIAYDQALSLHPDDPDLWNSRANALHELRRYDEEMHCYDQALALDPGYAFAWS